MSVNNHTAISVGAAANASTINTPLASLDAAIGNLSTLNTNPKTSVVAAVGTATPTTTATTIIGAINELDSDIGDVATLGTTPKSSLVAAIGTTTPTTTAQTISGAVNELDADIGDVSSLGTTPKTSLVAAIGTAAPTTTAQTIAGAINELDTDLGTLDANIGALASLTTADKSSAVAAINEVNDFLLNGGNVGGGIVTTGGLTATGSVIAAAFVGDGSALTGIASGTGGVTNTGSTTIGADTDSSGGGVIALQTRTLTRLEIGNDGTITIANNLAVGTDNDAVNTTTTGRVVMNGYVSPSSGVESVHRINAYAYNDAGGNQWSSQFVAMNTVAGQSTINELDSILTVLYHYEPFTVPLYKGIECGGGYVDGAGAEVTEFWGIDANIPTVTNSGSVGTAAAVHISAKALSGIDTPYAIYSELQTDSLFLGPVKYSGSGIGFETSRDGGSSTGLRATAAAASASAGGRFSGRFSRGTIASPTAVSASDLVTQLDAAAYIDGAYRTIGSLGIYVGAGPGVGSYPGQFLLRLGDTGSTSVATVFRVDYDGVATFGSSRAVGLYDIYSKESYLSGSEPLHFTGAMGDSSKNPTSDAPVDWIAVRVGSSIRYIPVYAA